MVYSDELFNSFSHVHSLFTASDESASLHSHATVYNIVATCSNVGRYDHHPLCLLTDSKVSDRRLWYARKDPQYQVSLTNQVHLLHANLISISFLFPFSCSSLLLYGSYLMLFLNFFVRRYLNGLKYSVEWGKNATIRTLVSLLVTRGHKKVDKEWRARIQYSLSLSLSICPHFFPSNILQRQYRMSSRHELCGIKMINNHFAFLQPHKMRHQADQAPFFLSLSILLTCPLSLPRAAAKNFEKPTQSTHFARVGYFIEKKKLENTITWNTRSSPSRDNITKCLSCEYSCASLEAALNGSPQTKMRQVKFRRIHWGVNFLGWKLSVSTWVSRQSIPQRINVISSQ